MKKMRIAGWLLFLALLTGACGEANRPSELDGYRVVIGDLEFQLAEADLEDFYIDRRPDLPKSDKVYRARSISSRSRYPVQTPSGETHTAQVSITWQAYGDPDASYQLDKPEESTLLFDYMEVGTFRGREARIAVTKKEFVNLHGRSLGRNIMFSEYLAPQVRLSVRATEDSLPVKQVPMYLNELEGLLGSWLEASAPGD